MALTLNDPAYIRAVESYCREKKVSNIRLSDITELDLWAAQSTDELRHFPNLRKLAITGDCLDNPDGLLTLPKLESLSFCMDDIADCSAVWKLTNLSELLIFGYADDGGNGPPPLSNLKNLRNLLLLGDNEQRIDGAAFKGFLNLESLDIRDVRLENAHELSCLKKLKVLILAICGLQDISFLEPLGDLKYLNLFYNEIRDLSPIRSLGKTTGLHISRNPIDWSLCSLRDLACLPCLTSLWVDKTYPPAKSGWRSPWNGCRQNPTILRT